MPTIVVSDEPYDSVMAGDVVPGKPQTRVVDRLDEAIPDDGDPCVWNGRPCILFGMRDLGEDWSGKYVNPDIHPFALIDAPMISVEEFWALVRKVHGLPDKLPRPGLV